MYHSAGTGARIFPSVNYSAIVVIGHREICKPVAITCESPDRNLPLCSQVSRVSPHRIIGHNLILLRITRQIQSSSMMFTNIPSQNLDSEALNEAQLNMLTQGFVIVFPGNGNELGSEIFPQSNTLWEVLGYNNSVNVGKMSALYQ
jgi:hypothetical protein